MTRARTVGLALAASFSVYLIPLVGPHGAWLLGESLFHGGSRKVPQWIAMNLAVALVLQLAAAGFFHWFFGKPGWRRAIPLLLAFPFVFVALQGLYLVKIPAMFLEEPDVAPEKNNWPVVCTVPGVYMTNLQTPSEPWVRFNNQPNNYAVLTMPGCRLATVSLPQPKYTPGSGVDFMIDITSVYPEGRAIARRYDNKGRKVSWWLISRRREESGTSIEPLEPPAGHSDRDGAPILSTDGRWGAWLVVIPNTGPPVLNRVLLRPREPGEKEKVVDLTALGPAMYVLKRLDMAAGELDLWRTDRLITVGLDGNLRREFGRPASARPQPATYQKMGNFWLAWDAYREDGSYRMEWSLPSGSGSHRVPLGRGIHSAAFDDSGKWIAVSVGTALNIGKARDAVYVLSAADGHEVFRRYLPPYSRSPVAFLEGGFFAYSDRGGVRVIRIVE